jgi:CRISPR-associated protein (TIGR02710 family)
VKRSNISSKDILVDYTGGTKVMTAALILATAGQKYRFNYVGGGRRNKEGVGTVISGHEKMFAEMSPWAIFAEEERRQVIILFNSRRFSAVMEIIDSAGQRELPVQIRNYFRFIRPLAEGFLKWDQFEHKPALRFLDKGCSLLSDYLGTYLDTSLQEFLEDAQKCKEFLEKVYTQTEGLKIFQPVLVVDILNNARRKIADKRYDDAAARIYRALELHGQIVFHKVAGCSNDKVKPEILPENIKEEFLRKYRDPHKQLLKLPLTATFEFLKVKGNKSGIRFFDRQMDIKKILNNRNTSILAHGIRPVSEKAVNSIFHAVCDFVQIREFFDFPLLP